MFCKVSFKDLTNRILLVVSRLLNVGYWSFNLQMNFEPTVNIESDVRALKLGRKANRTKPIKRIQFQSKSSEVSLCIVTVSCSYYWQVEWHSLHVFYISVIIYAKVQQYIIAILIPVRFVSLLRD